MYKKCFQSLNNNNNSEISNLCQRLGVALVASMVCVRKKEKYTVKPTG